jgi:hypothetical protein
MVEWEDWGWSRELAVLLAIEPLRSSVRYVGPRTFEEAREVIGGRLLYCVAVAEVRSSPSSSSAMVDSI